MEKLKTWRDNLSREEAENIVAELDFCIVSFVTLGVMLLFKQDVLCFLKKHLVGSLFLGTFIMMISAICLRTILEIVLHVDRKEESAEE